jgi:hypothetical protein
MIEGLLLPPIQGGIQWGAHPGERSFLAHPWASKLHAVGVREVLPPAQDGEFPGVR